MSASFNPIRQRISRLLTSLGVGGVARALYDFGYFSWKRTLNRNSLEARMAEKPEVTADEISSLLNLLVPQRFNGELTRLGPVGDGGYLVPTDWNKVDALFSPGIAGSSDFELEFARAGIGCFLIDASVDGPTVNHSLFSFQKKYLGTHSGGDWISLGDWLRESNADSRNLALQMDIEGYEWDVINNADFEDLSKFRLLLIEHHDFFKLSSREFFRTVDRAVRRLLETHVPVHVHGNNFGLHLRFGEILVPQVLEITWLRRDDYSFEGLSDLPHALDRPNNSRFKDLVLSEIFKGDESQR